MTLFDILPQCKQLGFNNAEVNGVTDNSRKLKKGDIFVCVKGAGFDGHNVAQEMLDKGASAVVCERNLGLKQQILVENTRAYFSLLASRFYGEPTKKLKMLAVTGTNGKTTIVNLVKYILKGLGHKTGSIGTVGYDVGDKVYEAHLTTPLADDLYRMFSEMVENGCEYCVMEASSQALSQFRIANENFVCSAFTNLTQDHLDYHGTMENYFLAKKSLFDMTKTAVINVDDDYGKRLANQLDIPVITYSISETADFYATDIESKSGGISFNLVDDIASKSYPVAFKMPGLFNVGNSIAALLMCKNLGLDIQQCIKILETCTGVKGRSEVIYDGLFTVICDYAHTEDALLKILTSVRQFTKGRLLLLFGAAGERDSVKRPLMGECAATHADYLVVTSDNPRFENPELIIEQVLQGVKKHNTPYKSFVDRLEAIKHILSVAEKDDVVLLAGKGHETYQVIGDEYQDFDEHKIVSAIMNDKNPLKGQL